jgi:hypothetical protein
VRERAAPVAGFRPAPADVRRWRSVQVGLAVVLLLALAAAAGATAVSLVHDMLRSGDQVLVDYAAGRGGRTVQSQAGRFVAVFPASPREGTESLPGGSDGSASRLAVTVGKATFVVAWFDLPSTPTDPAAVLSLLASATARDLNARIGDRGILRSEAQPQHDFGLSVGTNRTVLVRHVVAGRRVYVVRVDARTALDKAFARFADSLEILDAGGAARSGA